MLKYSCLFVLVDLPGLTLITDFSLVIRFIFVVVVSAISDIIILGANYANGSDYVDPLNS